MKRVFYIFWIFTGILTANNTSAQLYVVNNPIMGFNDPFIGGAEGSLDKMIENAVNYANLTSLTATIELDVSSGIIPIDIAMPTINHSNGRIVIKKATGAITQNLVGSFPNCFKIENSSHVEIYDLVFQNFSSSAIWARNPSSLKVERNQFFENEIAVDFDYQIAGSQTEVNKFNDNLIENCNAGIRIIYERVLNDVTPDPFDYLFPNDFAGQLCEIKGNTLNQISSHAIDTRKYSNDIFVQFETADNLISNSTFVSTSVGISISNPFDSLYICDNNTIINHGIGIRSGFTLNPVWTKGHGLEFIKAPNSLGLSDKNANNTIINCETAFRFSPRDDGFFEYQLVGYTVEGNVVVSGFPSTIRENLIKTSTHWTSGSFLPIDHTTSSFTSGVGNKNILYPLNITPTFLLNYLDIQYDLFVSPQNIQNTPYIVEFFELDNQNSLVQYLGNQTITSNLPATYNKQFFGLTITPGNRIGMTVTSLGDNGERAGTSEVGFSDELTQKTTPDCESCLASFQPVPDEKYWLSAWVSIDNPNAIKTISGVSLDILFLGVSSSQVTFTPTGNIIDGWQRIVGSFTVPPGTEYLGINLNANSVYDTYFDDIRIHPFNASMKSYVYDGETFWLTSELDDNNYATFYEYDEEGGLIRIKKETARGIVTIQETRSNTVKND